GRAVDTQVRPTLVDVGGDRAEKVGLTEARRPVEEEGVVGLAGELGDGEGGGVAEAVARADDEALERVEPIEGERDRRRVLVGPARRRLREDDAIDRVDPLAGDGLDEAAVATLDPRPARPRGADLERPIAKVRRPQRLQPELEGGRRKARG